MEEWERHFLEILEGEKVGDRSEEKVENLKVIDESIEDLEREEVWKAIKISKYKKATGPDKMTNEELKHAPGNVFAKTHDILNRIWKGEGFPENWKIGRVFPIFKKGDRELAKNYRGITLMNTMYKIYTQVLANKLQKELDQNKVLPDTQAGFRKERSTMDNIFILNHIVQRELQKKRGKVCVFFVDLRAAFDRVDRETLWKALDKGNISKNLIERIKEIYTETKSIIEVNGKSSGLLKTSKGVRQGCPKSPILFATVLGDIEKYLKGRQNGGIIIGNEKIFSLAYADDLEILATSEEELMEMIKDLEKYFKKKKLEVNTEKSKTMIFKKHRGKAKKWTWKWKNQDIEQVKDFRYLGFYFQQNGKFDSHIRETVKKASFALNQVWSIGVRKFGFDFVRRMKLFDSLVKSIIMYGAEIWGFKEWIQLERLQTRYLKWTLGLKKCTPTYILNEETRRKKISVDSGKLALKYEEKCREAEHKITVRECIKEMDKTERPESKCGRIKERELYLRRCGLSSAGIRERRTNEKETFLATFNTDLDNQIQDQRNRIQDSKYNVTYKRLVCNQLPEYLRRHSSLKEQQLVARFRCGNETLENEYWTEEANRLCRICYGESESLDHILNRCILENIDKSEKDSILDEDGKGFKWLKEIKDARKKAEEQRQLITPTEEEPENELEMLFGNTI